MIHYRKNNIMEEKKPLTLLEKQAIIFDQLKEVDQFCRANNIKYSIAYGTLLGAIRHGGFVPWDDDADIIMLREDYDKFASTFKSDRFHMLQFTHNPEDKEIFFNGYLKINDPSTYIASKQHLIKYGVGMDIFPLDPVPEDDKQRHIVNHKIRRISNRLWHRHKKDPVSIIKAYRHSLDEWWNILNNALQEERLKYMDSPIVTQFFCAKEDEVILRKSFFDELIEIPFNGYNFFAFKDYHEYLTISYGEDYMTPKTWAQDFEIYRK